MSDNNNATTPVIGDESKNNKKHGRRRSNSTSNKSPFVVLNPRNLWQRWRNNKLTPRFRRQAPIDELLIDHCIPLQAAAAAQPSALQPARKMLLEDHPPSPVANEAALHELMRMNSSTGSTNNENDNAVDAALQLTTPRLPDDLEDNMSVYSLTPPACAVLPYMVSAKKHAAQIRSKHSSKRRRRPTRPPRQLLGDQTNTMLTMTNMSVAGSNNTASTNSSNSMINNTMMQWRDDDNDGYAAYSSDDDDGMNEELEAWNRETSQYTSPAERTRHYWQVCYGTVVTEVPESSWSAQRVAPTKSCLSSTKARRRSLPARHASTANLVRTDSHRSPMLPPKAGTQDDPFSLTRLVSICETPAMSASNNNKRKVQFGALSAAEYERDEPPSSAMKPMRPDQISLLYSLEQKEVPPEEATMVEETKCNSQTLAAWDDAFDHDSDDDDRVVSRKRRRRQSSNVFSPNVSGSLLGESSLSSPPVVLESTLSNSPMVDSQPKGSEDTVMVTQDDDAAARSD